MMNWCGVSLDILVNNNKSTSVGNNDDVGTMH